MLKDTMMNLLKENKQTYIDLRRYFHQNPEPSFEEENTANKIAEILSQFENVEVKRNVGNGYGIVATLKGSQPGPTIALRADFDALRIQEESGVPFASKNEGIMHACGHDAHTAALLSVVDVMSKHQAQMKGNVVFIFQNAEEVQPGGAKSMVEAGALEGVDAIFGIHISSLVPVGKIGFNRTYGSACSDTIKIHVQGRGGHAANPHLCADSVIIAAEIITNLQTIVSRSVNPVNPAVLTFGGVSAGGEAHNVIADTATIVGTARTLDQETRKLVKEKVFDGVKTIAKLNGGSATIDYTDGYPSIINTEKELKVVCDALNEEFGEGVVFEQQVGMGGEDFAYYLQAKPGVFFHVGAQVAEPDKVYPHHHPRFMIDEQCIFDSARAFCAVLQHYLF